MQVSKLTLVFPFFSSSIRVESRCAAAALAVRFVVTVAVTTGGARGEAKWVDVAGEDGDLDARGGGAGATNPARVAAASVEVPMENICVSDLLWQFIPKVSSEAIMRSFYHHSATRLQVS